MLQLPIEPHDRVVAAFPFRDKVLVVTQNGKVFEIAVHEEFGYETRLVSS